MSKSYVVVGTGGRSRMFTNALVNDFKKDCRLKAFCDSNSKRMEVYNDYISKEFKHRRVPMYKSNEFDKMIAEQKPDAVIVTTIDRMHHHYIIRAMELGCDVISEKPMTTDAEKCQMIVDTVKKTGRKLTVTFNYRYSPRNTKVKEVLSKGIAGEIISVHFEWLLDTSHGADYFRRWHRDKRNSGGLMVHKATHHFDLMNWWLDSSPETVFGMGDLRFYGKANAEKRGVTEFYSRSRNSEIAAKDPFALKVTDKDKWIKALYYDAESEDSYYRDQSVFGDGISIEDSMSVMVKYRNRAVMTYSLNAFCPWEGYRVCFNGTKGRLEFNVVETSYVSGHHQDFNMPGMRELEGRKESLVPEIIFQPLWGKPQVIDYEKGDLGGHGGGDVRLLNDVFKGVKDNSLKHAAGFMDGAMSILTGIAANESFKTGLPVKVSDLVKF